MAALAAKSMCITIGCREPGIEVELVLRIAFSIFGLAMKPVT